MHRKLPIVLVLGSLCSLGLAAISYHRSPPQPAVESGEAKRDPLVAKFSDYRKWILVNPVPELMELAAAIDCVRIPGRDESSPHLNKYISVYVNETGRDAMMTQRTPRFPPGSLIVKEKLSSKTSTEPEILTAMVKHEQGYNPESGDWEYLVLNGNASAILEQGKLARCQSCHLAYRSSDFITRTYLPREVRQRLR